MSTMPYIILGVCITLLVLVVVLMYNSLVTLRNKVNEAFSTMDVFLKKRADLVPNLVAIVKAYAAHEAATLENIVKARNGEGTVANLENEAKIGNEITKVLAVVEKYPELKANENFLDLQNKLTKIEEDIAFSRRYYNGSVREYNDKCQMFPSNIFAKLFSFKAKPMFKYVTMLLLALLPQWAMADAGGFYIRNWNVNMTVHENKECDVTETVELTFTEPRHGFYRYVPYTFSQKFFEADGKTRTLDYEGEVKNVKVDGWEYDTEDQNNNEVIRIGSANSLVNGDQTYIIHYTLVLPDDRFEQYDPFHFTLLPVDNRQDIQHFYFRINFDKDLPEGLADELILSYGSYGEEGVHDKVLVKQEGNVITGWADDITPFHTVTLYAGLPEGYFVGEKSTSSLPSKALFFATIILFLFVIVKELTTKHPHITKSIEFYPPEGISSAEVGTIIDETVDIEDIASLIPWWAGKGYITIKEYVSKKFFGGEDIQLELTKLCNLPSDAPGYQKQFMKLIFGNETTVQLSDVGDKHEQMENVKKNLNNVFKGKKKLTHTKYSIGFLYLALLLGALMFIFSSPVSMIHEDSLLIGALAWFLPAFVGIIWKEINRTRQYVSAKWGMVVSFIIRLVAMVGVAFIYYYVVTTSDNGSLLPVEWGVAVFVVGFIACELSNRFTVNTEYRTEMMGKLLGLKEFIKTAEKPQLVSLQQDDPEYFYKVIPYAMVFGLTDKWTKLFKDIKVECPQWYHSNSVVTDTLFVNHFNNALMNSAINDIKVMSVDSSSAASGSSGVSFSGGGAGGGGCGSW